MAYQSPYGRGGGVTFQPPAGIAALIAQDRANVEQGLRTLGSVAGGIGAGAIGAAQAAASPETFGAGTSKGSAALQGFAQNYENAMNDQSSGVGALMGGRGRGGVAGGGGGTNFKQLQLAGKTADSFREMVKSQERVMPGQEASTLGVSDDQWKTMGALEKFSTVGQMFQAQQYQAAEQAYRKGLQDYARAAAQTQGIQADNAANSAFGNAVMTGQLARGGGAPVRATFEDVQGAALANPTAPAAQGLLQQMARNAGESRPTLAEGRTQSGTPYVTYGNSFQFDPRAVGDMRQQNQIDLLNERERARAAAAATLTPEQLLKSYQTDLAAITKDWQLSPEIRAQKRAELEASIEALRGGAATPKPTSRSAEPMVKSKAEFDKLPSGTVYIGKDGQRYRKP